MKKAKIVIIEDQSVVAEDLRTTLQDGGHEVVAVYDAGENALIGVLAHQVDLALVDVVLRGKMPGTDLAERLHHDYGIPVIFVTAFGNEELRVRAARANPAGYIVKPFSPKELLETVENALP
ncbi:MAG: response regulator [Armatimonadetes bacterium]|nr:response regulator [Armatimonadota bacterium]